MAITVTSVTNAGVDNIITPSTAATFTWTTSMAQAYYQVRYREVGTVVWTNTMRTAGSTQTYTIPANTLRADRYYEWCVRAWNASQEISPWYSMIVLVSKYPTLGIVHVGTNKLRAVAVGNSVATQNVKIKLPNDATVRSMDIVPRDDYAASPVKIAVVSNDVKAFARELEVYTPEYADHTNTGNILYNNHADTGYSAYSNHSNSYSQTYNNHSDSYSNVYKNHSDSYANTYNDHDTTQYLVMEASGYTVYSNHTNYTATM